MPPRTAPPPTSSPTVGWLSRSGPNPNPRGTPQLRFVNAAAGPRLRALQLDDQRLFDNVKATSVTDYREVKQRMIHLSAHATGRSDTTALADENRVLEDGKRYTAFLMTENMAAYRLRIVQDDVILDSGQALSLLHIRRLPRKNSRCIRQSTTLRKNAARHKN